MIRSAMNRSSNKKAPTVAERAHMGRVAELGCIVCRKDGRPGVSAQVHHMKVNPLTGLHLGLGQRSSHYHTIPLCPFHHGPGNGGGGYHDNPRTFTLQHGTEIELFRWVCQLLKLPDGTK
jgi:hypothetical protein